MQIRERTPSDLCLNFPLGESASYSSEFIEKQEAFAELVMKLRELRTHLKLKNREEIKLSLDADLLLKVRDFMPKVQKLTWVSSYDTDLSISSNNTVLVRNKKVVVHADKEMDADELQSKVEDEIKYIQGFIASIESKLKNENFVSKAPEKVIEVERKKLADGKEKLKKLQEQLK